MRNIRAFTLIEVLVVVAILVLVGALTMPGISAMNAASAHANAKNTINAALQGVRSYAIMNNVKAAARFQPNGKVSFVYKFTNNSETAEIDDGGTGTTYPDATTTPPTPNNEGYIYLPVIDQTPLQLPASYSVANSSHLASLDYPDPANASNFWEPFYICYNPDGTMAVGEDICVALVDDITTPNPEPVNPDFNDNDDYAWDNFPTYNLTAWLTFTQSSDDAVNTQDVDDRKLARYFYVATTDTELQTIFTTDENAGIDHYAGNTGSTTGLTTPSITQFCLFKTPAGWSQLPLFIDDTTTATKTQYVEEEFTKIGKTSPYEPNEDKYETIFLNPYTGRVIKPVE
jgi:prepilin-type N-terminal cleavage/methylation domain-containing protein